MRTILVCALAACATAAPPPPKGGPRGLRASEHLEAARQHEEAAKNVSSWPSTTPMTPGGVDTPKNAPWFRTWDTGAEQERLARAHRGEAAALQAAYEEACGDTPLARIAVSPLLRYRTGGWNTSSGVVVYLSPLAGTPDALLASLRCHRAWMMLAPSGMDDCPLDLPNLTLDARGDNDGITLVLSVRDPKLVPELQRRIARQVETRAHEGHED